MRLPCRRTCLPAICITAGLLFALNLHILFFNRKVNDGDESDTLENRHAFTSVTRQLGILQVSHYSVAVSLVKKKDTERAAHFSNKLFDIQGNFSFAPLPKNAPLFPDETADTNDDRIWNQMRYVPSTTGKAKRILLFNGMGGESQGQARFLKDNCPVSNCVLDANRGDSKSADVILWQHNVISKPFIKRPKNQVWAFFLLESPYHTGSLLNMRSEFNWSISYRHNSVIVAPYFKFTPYNFAAKSRRPSRNYASGKTKQVAWFVSNCGARNRRLEYARELGKHIQVDIYGGCGSKSCPRYQANSCFKMLNKDYKFYLAFENSNCRDYITEKFFLNGLSQNVLPIVMGAHPDDYKRVAPPNSFIHVDHFKSVSELAQYLHRLDRDDRLYNGYFAWKGMGMVDTNTFFWCRVCAMAHASHQKHYQVADAEGFWRGKGVCTSGSWRK